VSGKFNLLFGVIDVAFLVQSDARNTGKDQKFFFNIRRLRVDTFQVESQEVLNTYPPQTFEYYIFAFISLLRQTRAVFVGEKQTVNKKL